MEKIKYFVGFCVVILFVGSAINIFAQTTTSTIEGTVTDQNGAVIAGATVTATGSNLAAERTAVTDSQGNYRLVALPAGTYKVKFSQSGFADQTTNFELTLNRTAKLNVVLAVGSGEASEVTVTGNDVVLIDSTVSQTGATVTPRQIVELPVNGRDYLDLLQLVPGTAINRQANPEGDNANPVFGERSGNNTFLVDGHSNKDTVSGGPGSQFNQETIAEFQVLTTGFKAEFGQASGAVVNVITKSGGNAFHGSASLFHRNEAFDSSNALTEQAVPHLRRFDYSVALGGPIIKDKFFFFGSAERINQDKQLIFEYPDLGDSAGAQLVLDILRAQEEPFNQYNENRETRLFLKLNQTLGNHTFSQEFNYTNGLERDFLPNGSNSLPSRRTDSGERHLLLGFGDTMLLGDQGNPFIVSLRGSYRGEPSDRRPSHPEAGPTTTFNGYTVRNCNNCTIFGDLPSVGFGNGSTPSNLTQSYTALSAHANKRFNDHDIKFGWSFLRTKVDGLNSRDLYNQIFTTVDDFLTFGPINGGISILTSTGAVDPIDDEIHLRNNYNGLYVQDDWKLLDNLTLNLGLRWDHDSEFKANKNFSPRLGAAWAINDKTVVRANFGIFYDIFRLGLVSNVPEFGGADRNVAQDILFPRGFYGSPSWVSSIAFLSGLPGGCFSNTFTDEEITQQNLTCPFASSVPLIGVDRLNNVVAPGHSPIPANAVINLTNIQALSGLSPEEWLVQAAAAIGQSPDYFYWGAYGVLSNPVYPPQPAPTTAEGAFKTPNTLGFSVGIKREITSDYAIEIDYHHKNIRDILGTRKSNLAYQSRVAGIGITYLPPNTEIAINTFGPFFEGTYDGLVIAVNKRFSHRFQFGASYTYSHAIDNTLGISSRASDSYIGIVPEITEPGTGNTNIDGPFVSTNGNYVAQAGTFWNGPDVDKGPSDLALDHVFQAHGLVALPWDIQIGGIFRAQSGFRFSQSAIDLADPDGDSSTNGIDLAAGRNAFTAPPFINLDMRFSKTFTFKERFKAQILFEFFNVMNRKNPASVHTTNPIVALKPFGTTRQVLDGREGQIGIRFEF